MDFFSSRWVVPTLVALTMLGLLFAAIGAVSWLNFVVQTIVLWTVVLLARHRVS